jgi:cell division protein FtsB
MARNRKHQSAAIRFGPALKAFLLCMLIGGSGVGYVWQKSQIDRLSKQMKQREQRLIELQDTNEKLRRQLATLRSPAQLDRRVRELNLGLVPPQPNQVLRLIEPVPETPAPVDATRYAARDGAAQRMP